MRFRWLVLHPDTVAIFLISAMWGRTVLSLVALSFTADKTFVDVGEDAATSALSTAVSQVFFILILGIAAVVILFRMNEIPRVGLGRIGIVLFPWLWMVVRDAFNGHTGPDMLLYPFVILAIAALRPSPRVLRVLGVLIAVTAVVAILLGLFMPEAGILRETDGSERVSDKETLPGLGLLQGMFTSENNLAQYLVLGIPAVAMVKSLWARIPLLAVTVFAIYWTSSRGALVTLAVVAVVALGLWVLLELGRRRVASIAARVTVGLAMVVGAWLPLQYWPDDAFTYRALIWNGSLHEWLTFVSIPGFGSTWYDDIGKTATSPLNTAAYHAHNEFVQLGVTGGIVLIALAAIWFGMIGWRITRATNTMLIAAVSIIVGTLVSGYLEVPIGFVDRSAFWVVSVVPLVLFFFARPESPGRTGGPGYTEGNVDTRGAGVAQKTRAAYPG